MPAAARALLAGIIDYAGTFPPAGLTLPAAIDEYRKVKAGGDAWLVGRFILPAANLHEFETVGSGFSRTAPDVSIVLGPKPEARLREVLAFVERAGTSARVASLEFPPLAAADIRPMAASVPPGIESFFEVPVDADLDRRINAIEAAGASAKVRTGGVTAGVVPNPADLARFLEACNDAGVAFKATAGLHHCIRGCYALTYEAGSPTETMHGFLNLSVAAAVVHAGGTAVEAGDALVESEADAFTFGADGVRWRRWTLTIDQLQAMRQRLFRSFGSCSVREPLEELRRLNLL